MYICVYKKNKSNNNLKFYNYGNKEIFTNDN